MTINFGVTARRDLAGISADLKWSAVELRRIAKRLQVAGNSPDAQAILRMIDTFLEGEARLNVLANAISTECVV